MRDELGTSNDAERLYGPLLESTKIQVKRQNKTELHFFLDYWDRGNKQPGLMRCRLPSTEALRLAIQILQQAQGSQDQQTVAELREIVASSVS